MCSLHRLDPVSWLSIQLTTVRICTRDTPVSRANYETISIVKWYSSFEELIDSIPILRDDDDKMNDRIRITHINSNFGCNIVAH